MKKKMARDYAEGKSVYNPDNPNAMKIAAARATQVIPKKDQEKLSEEKLKQTRMIIVIDTIKDDVLYLKLTSPKPYLRKNKKFIEIANVLDNGKMATSLVDLNLDHLDYSNAVITSLKLNHISIKSDIMLSPQSIHKILNAANRNLRNLELSKRKKKES